jgi:RNA polymerase sigma factor (TIGR02999 family)
VDEAGSATPEPSETPGSAPSAVTRLLIDWRAGDERALDRLMPLVYEQLRALARQHMKRERAGHTLQATALVHEAYARLVNMEIAWKDRVHFFAVAARTMRRVLVEHARERGAAKRGGGWVRATLDEALVIADEPSIDFLALDAALGRLEAHDPRKGRAIELHYFGGLGYEETAEVLGVSEATVHRDLRMAKAWLYHELGGA